MTPIARKRFVRCLCCLALAAFTLPTTGCIAAAVTGGVVAAGAAGYAYYQGAVPRDYPANMDLAWTATQQAVTDLGMPIDKAVRDNDGGTIETKTGDGEKVVISLEPRAARVQADGQWTHVSVRVAFLGDGPLSERILNGIDARLPHPEAAGVPGAADPTGRIQPVAATSPQQTGPPPLGVKSK